jgi:hypothetical protein
MHVEKLDPFLDERLRCLVAQVDAIAMDTTQKR